MAKNKDAKLRLAPGVYYLRHKFNTTGRPKCIHLTLTQSGYAAGGAIITRADVTQMYRYHHAEVPSVSYA